MKAMKKILTMLLTAVALFSFFAAGAFAAGDGTAGDPLQISTEAELLAFASRVGGGETGLCAVLTANITVADWTPISIGRPASSPFANDSTTPYTGTFDGDGHKLTLSKALTEGTTAQNRAIALFHTIDTDGVVRNIDLDVAFEGHSYIAGVAVINYGTIEYVTVDGSLKTATNAESYIGGITAWNGCKTVGDEIVAGKILHCINEATISCTKLFTSGKLDGYNYGVSYAGGICGSFLGEMRYCANLGEISFNFSSANNGTGGLFALRTPSDSAVQKLIVSDCYNAGTMYSVGTSVSVYSGSLFGGAGWHNITHWLEKDALKISNVFAYGLIVNPYLDLSTSNKASVWNIISGAVDNTYTDLHAAAIYSNIYYRPEIGGRLFPLAALIGDDGYGTGYIKNSIKGKTVKEFASVDMAVLLNNGRRGEDAPWEYIEGNPYPTLKFENTTGTPGIDYIPVALDIIVDYGYGGVITAAGTEGLAIEQCTVAAIDGYRIDTISVDGVRLENVHGLTEYTTTVSPKTAIFATFSYSLNFNAPAGGTLSVSRGSETLTSGSMVHALEVLSVTYDGPGRLVPTGLTAAGNAGEYRVTALRATGGPTITIVPVSSGGSGGNNGGGSSGGGNTGGTGGSTNTGGSTTPGDSNTTAVTVPDGDVTVPSDTVINESTGVATLPSGGEITLADGATALIVPPDTTIDLDTGIITVTQSGGLTLADGATEVTVPPDTTIDPSTGIITVTQGGAVTLPAGDASDGLGIEFVVPPGTTIDPETGIVSVAADAGALTLPGADGATGSDQDIQLIVPDGTTIDPATGTVTAVKGGWVVLPGPNRKIETESTRRSSRGAEVPDDLEFNVTPGTTVDPYTGSVMITEGGEITLPDGTTVTVLPGTTIHPLTGVRNEPDATNEGSNNTGETDNTDTDGSSGGCDAGSATLAAVAAAALMARKRRKV